MRMYTCIAHAPPYHEMTHTIELRSLNSISRPKFGVNSYFLEPEDPSRINFSGLVARKPAPHTRQPQHACDWGSMQFGISGATVGL